jgi:hypothetical protein
MPEITPVGGCRSSAGKANVHPPGGLPLRNLFCYAFIGSDAVRAEVPLLSVLLHLSARCMYGSQRSLFLKALRAGHTEGIILYFSSKIIPPGGLWSQSREDIIFS